MSKKKRERSSGLTSMINPDATSVSRMPEFNF
jgi:hypothetical protein